MNNSNQRAWPSDADGDVFRRLKANKFDFSKKVDVDFNIDFDIWPPSPELMNVLKTRFSDIKTYVPDVNGDGYVQITLSAVLTYDFVMFTQASLTALATPYGGTCESWGVLQD